MNTIIRQYLKTLNRCCIRCSLVFICFFYANLNASQKVLILFDSTHYLDQSILLLHYLKCDSTCDVSELPLNKELINNPIGAKVKILEYNPSLVIIIGNTEFKMSNSKVTDYFFSYLNDPLNPEIIVTRLPTTSLSQLNDYLAKHKRARRVSSYDLYSNTLIYDAVNAIRLESKLDQITVKYAKSFTRWNLINKLKIILLRKSKSNIVNLINHYKPGLFIYIGHGSKFGWENNQQLNKYNLEQIANNIYYYQFDITCSTASKNIGSLENNFMEKALLMSNKGAIASISPTSKTKIESIECLYISFISGFNSNSNFGVNFLNFQKNIARIGCRSELENFSLFGIPL